MLRKLVVWVVVVVVLAPAVWFAVGFVADFPLRHVRSAYDSGNYLRAVQLAQSRLQENPDDHNAKLLMARAYARLSRWDLAEVFFSQVELNTREDLYLRAFGLETRELFEEAAFVNQEILKKWPSDPKALRSLAAIRSEQHRHTEALEFAKQLAEVESHQVTGLVMVGQLQFMINEHHLAVDALEQAVKLSPKLEELPAGEPANAMLVLAEAYLSIGRAKDAERFARRGRDLSNSPEACWLLARSLNQLGKPEDELKALKETIARDAAHVPALREIGRYHLNQRESDRAIYWIEKAYDLQPTNKATIILLISAYRQAGRNEDAKKLLEQSSPG